MLVEVKRSVCIALFNEKTMRTKAVITSDCLHQVVNEQENEKTLRLSNFPFGFEGWILQKYIV